MLLREVAFASASMYNRASFLMQVTRVFHSNPYYKVITALDYHQCLCLLCTDFPRTLVAEAAKTIPVHPSYVNNPALTTTMVSTLSHEPVLFDKFDLADLKASVELFFYYSEFLEAVKTVFTDLLSGNFSYKEEVSIGLLLTSIRSLISRESCAYLKYPPLDLLLEALLTKANKKLQLSPEEFYTLEDVLPLVTSCGTISFCDFCLVMSTQTLMRHPKFQCILYDQFQPNPNTTQLTELAQEVPYFPHSLPPELSPPRDKKKRDKKKR